MEVTFSLLFRVAQEFVPLPFLLGKCDVIGPRPRFVLCAFVFEWPDVIFFFPGIVGPFVLC
jgi:hypothetical protein